MLYFFIFRGGICPSLERPSPELSSISKNSIKCTDGFTGVQIFWASFCIELMLHTSSRTIKARDLFAMPTGGRQSNMKKKAKEAEKLRKRAQRYVRSEACLRTTFSCQHFRREKKARCLEQERGLDDDDEDEDMLQARREWAITTSTICMHACCVLYAHSLISHVKVKP